MNKQINDPQWHAAAYLRTSKGVHEDESNTIETQLAIIQQFVNEHPDIKLSSIKTDNGFTGLNENQPAFQELMREINDGMYNCVIVKDLSGLGRNHLDVGLLLFRKLPHLGIRVISICNYYDSLLDDQIESIQEHWSKEKLRAFLLIQDLRNH